MITTNRKGQDRGRTAFRAQVIPSVVAGKPIAIHGLYAFAFDAETLGAKSKHHVRAVRCPDALVECFA
jgi:hypothetical protein